MRRKHHQIPNLLLDPVPAVFLGEEPLQARRREVPGDADRVKADAGHWEQVLAAPPYGPQVISSIASFASFASLSSSAMSFIATREYYQGSFDSGYFNMGLIVALGKNWL